MIVEDEYIIAQDLEHILSSEDYNICGIADTYNKAIDLYCTHYPDIIICDIYLKGNKTGIDFVNSINEIKPIPIIFITAYSSNEIFQQVTEINHISYITKPFTNLQVVAAVKLASARIRKSMNFPALTRKEMEVLILIKEGIIKNEDIAARLNVTSNTVKSHKQQLFKKFNVSLTSDLLKILLKS